MNSENILKPLGRSYVYFPFLCAAFLLGLMLLFYRELDCTIRTVLVPAIAVYMIGTSIIGYIYFELDVRNCVKAVAEKRDPLPQPLWITIIFWLAHIIWFLFLARYLFYKNML